MSKDIANCINIISDFCGKRDIDFLTKEEKKIIDLAYKMGKTNQFLIESTIYKKR